jgi:hypothetical protein
MSKFVFVYSGGSMALTPEEQEASMQEWGTWFGTLGEAITDPGNPFGASSAVTADGSVSGAGKLGASGYTVITADSLDAATAAAKGCPVLSTGGAVDVYEALEM